MQRRKKCISWVGYSLDCENCLKSNKDLESILYKTPPKSLSVEADEVDDGYKICAEIGWVHQYTPAVLLWGQEATITVKSEAAITVKSISWLICIV